MSGGDLLNVTTDTATYLLHAGSHARPTRIADETLRHVDGIVLESGMMQYDDLSIDKLRQEPQYGELIQESEGKGTDIFVVDVPYTCSDLRVLLTQMAWLGVPFIAGFLGMLHLHAGLGLLMLPVFAMALGGAPSRLLRTVAGYAQVSTAYTSLGFRSAVTAENLEQQVAPQLQNDIGRRPVILTDYGTGHLDLAVYLRHPRLRRAVIRFGAALYRSTLAVDARDRVVRYSIDADAAQYEQAAPVVQ